MEKQVSVEIAKNLMATENRTMRKLLSPAVLAIFTAFMTAACQQTFDKPSQSQQTPFPSTPISQNPTYTCADIETYWGNNWPLVIEALDTLIRQNESCGEESLLSKQYAAHFNYATMLESTGDVDAAVEQYTSAFSLDANRTEALDALIRLESLPDPTAVPCDSDLEPLPDPAAAETVDSSTFVRIENNEFRWQEQPFAIRGVNYYPRHAPWHQFLTEADLSEIESEFSLINQAGFNTMRIFLWYEPLFSCEPESGIPNEPAFEKVDEIIQLANQYNLKLIITLNDLPDLTFRPLYTDWNRYDAQTTYIVRRYRHEPAILAWDLRNEGDLDYGARLGDEAVFEQDQVINWLDHISGLVRENDPNHLITAGWWGNPKVTEPYVDFLSFHHWYDTQSLELRIDEYVQQSEKPILLEEIGYHSWEDAPQDQRDEMTQAVLIHDAVELVEEKEILGWLIWTAFDFTPKSGQEPNFEHHFGLWRSDLSAKLALEEFVSD